MKLEIPLGFKIEPKEEKNKIQIKVKHTDFWIEGIKKNKDWNIYLIDPQNDKKEIIEKKITTKLFRLFSEKILKTSFPYQGKNTKSFKIVKNFIIKITKKTNDKK